MKGQRFALSPACGATPRSGSRLTLRAIAACLLTMALSHVGCARNEPSHQAGSPTAIERPAPQSPPQATQSGRSSSPEPHSLEGSGIVVGAKEYQGALIAGLDGALYDPYRPVT